MTSVVSGISPASQSIYNPVQAINPAQPQYGRDFNAAIVTMANRVCPAGFDVLPPYPAGPHAFDLDHAPESLGMINLYHRFTGRIAVSDAHSDRTIYGDPEVNYAFRAWHDWTHWQIQAELTPEGERDVCKAQQADLCAVFGKGSLHGKVRGMCLILHAEIVGQVEYEQRHGYFPDDQVRFVREYLKSPAYALSLIF